MLHAETPFCFNPDAAAPQDLLFYPDSFTRGIFWVGMTGQNKVVQGKKAILDQNSYSYGGKLFKRLGNYGEVGCQTAHEDQCFLKFGSGIDIDKFQRTNIRRCGYLRKECFTN